MRRSRNVFAVAGAAAVLLAVGCAVPAPEATPSASATSTRTPTARVTPTPSPAPPPRVREAATGLAAPWSVVFRADGTPLVSERDSADVREVLPDGSTRVLGRIPGVAHGGEGGLLGLAVAPDGALHAYSTAADGNRIQRFPLSGAPGALALGEPRTLLERLPAAAVHNGGRIAFGPDGMLYATVGDAGDRWSAQDPDSLGGKLLRMTPDGGVPADNPVPGSLVYSLGHRNPQGIDWDEDGTLYLAEFGQDTWDELNIIRAGGNYGWPEAEGAVGASRFVDPVQQWRTDEASPSGLAVVDDTVYIANLRGERLRAVPTADPGASVELLIGQYGRLRAAAAGPDGALWILTNNSDGRGDPRPGDDRLVSIPLPLLQPGGG